MKVWKWVLSIGVIGFVGYGIWAYTGLSSHPTVTQAGNISYGTPSKSSGTAVSIKEALTSAQANNASQTPVTIQGKVDQMGPTMGCWIQVDDGTGKIFVQTNPMVYEPQSLLGSTVQVTGTFIHGNFGGMGYSGNDVSAFYLLSPSVQVVKKS